MVHRQSMQCPPPRRIDEHGVFAQQAAIGLVELNEKIQVGFLHRFTGVDLDQAAIASQDGRNFRSVEENTRSTPAPELVRRQADR